VAEGERQPFKITSTLDGKCVVPLQMHRLAYPNLPASKISRVDFLIDGKVRWTERNAPYGYGGGEVPPLRVSDHDSLKVGATPSRHVPWTAQVALQPMSWHIDPDNGVS
jgi:hypothetical protein